MVWNMHAKDNYSESEPRVPIYKVNEGREPPRELDDLDLDRTADYLL